MRVASPAQRLNSGEHSSGFLSRTKDPRLPQARVLGFVLLRRGFTLIELLVAMAILAVLAGLLLPAASMLKDMARATRCQTNQRQVVMAAFAYANDNKRGLPATRLATGSYWHDLLMNYLEIGNKGATAANFFENTIVRGCPSYEYVYSPTNFNYSYGINAYLDYGNGRTEDNQRHNRIGGTSDPLKWKEFRLTAIRKAPTRLYFADRDAFWTGTGMGNFAWNTAEVRHRNRITVTFVDGRGARLTAAEALTAQSAP